MGGEGKLGRTLGLVYVLNVLQICGGAIQNSEQRLFCCKTASGACSTKGQKTKEALSTKTLYVKHTRNGHARLEPSLSVNLLPDDVMVAELLGQQNSLEVWVAYFESLQAESAALRLASMSTGMSSPWEEIRNIDNGATCLLTISQSLPEKGK
jgi:hypothetical protein